MRRGELVPRLPFIVKDPLGLRLVLALLLRFRFVSMPSTGEKRKKQRKIRELRWNVKHGKTKNRTLRPEEIEERKKMIEALLEPVVAPGTHDLYIMENSRIPGELKIGYSKDVPRRKKEFEAQQNFRMYVLAVFPGKGYLENQVHDILDNFRVAECAGTEWFKCSLGEALAAIDQVLRRA